MQPYKHSIGPQGKGAAYVTREQWLAIKNGDGSFDGRFYYALKTTKKICRPSCRKKNCDPKKVLVFDTLDEALALGFHPCGRCRPDRSSWEGTKTELARSAESFIREHYTEKFSLDALAGALHIDKSYLLRTFKAITGSTLLEFHNRVRCEAARELLTRPELSISYIASAVGYVSASHFTQVFRKIVGKTPSDYRAAYLESLDD